MVTTSTRSTSGPDQVATVTSPPRVTLRHADRQRDRRRAVAIAAVALAWAAWRAGFDNGIVNTRGFSSFAEFWSAAFRPELSVEFIRLTADAALTTLALAILGTVASILFAAVGAIVTSELLWKQHPLRSLARGVLVVPRGIHEVIWALLLVQIFGFDPVVAVLAIAIPYGAVTSKVFAEAIDEADPQTFHQLRATGASRASALFYGVLPTIRHDLVSYSFYRMECAVRSAAVLGVVGVGGLGFQLDLSFETLRYNEIWTLIFALMILSGGIDRWSSVIRRSSEERVNRYSLVAVLVLVPLSVWWAGLGLSRLWGGRTATLANELIGELVRPRLGPGGWSELIRATIDTVALSLLALAVAVVGGLIAAIIARRRTERAHGASSPGRASGFVMRFALLLARAVPAPMWAFLAVLILFPGLWPGAVGLGIYNLGVLGRLFADVIEDRDTAATDQLLLTGAGPTTALLYGALPSVAPRIVALALYRWEVIVRETVVVGVVGAGGLGQLINDHLVARDFSAVSGAVLALIALTVLADLVGSRLRRQLR